MTDQDVTKLVALSVEDYIKELSKCDLIDERIEKMLTYMKLQLSHGELHPLSRFWKMRKFCLDLFKEKIAVSRRLQLWKEYCQVIDEIVKIKELMDEKSAYEREQIEDALTSIAQDIEQIDEWIQKEPAITVPKCSALSDHKDFYITTQKELTIYSSYAKRLNALKKEILALDISFKRKQEILDHIHTLADKVFPEKRRLLNLMSSTYARHIQQFIQLHADETHYKMPIYQLKEQIKQLQNFAKLISLNVEAFSKTRDQLSHLWDQLKTQEKQQKREKEEKKEHSTELFSQLSQKIEQLIQEKPSLNEMQLSQKLEQLNSAVQKEAILAYQKKQLMTQLEALKITKESKESQSEHAVEFENFLKTLHAVHQNVARQDYEAIENDLKVTLSRYDLSHLTDSQCTKAERAIFSIREALNEKLKGLTDEKAYSCLEQFVVLLKESIANYKKALSSSNQSIEKAMVFNELLVQTRTMLSPLEKRLADLKKTQV